VGPAEALVQSYSEVAPMCPQPRGRVHWYTWRIQSNCASAMAMRPHVELLLPLVIIIKPHRSTTYVDAACCYRPSSVVCLSVSLSH